MPLPHHRLSPRNGAGTFWLGTHMPSWLSTAGVPLLVAQQRLRGARRLPLATAPWVLDSGAYNHLRTHGRWTISTDSYAIDVRRYADEIGRLYWAAPMDWPCDAASLAKTGLSIGEHITRTVDSYVTLRELAPKVPWIPVLQGWQQGDYDRCAERYRDAGVDLNAARAVGVGSLSGRKNTLRVACIVSALAADGFRVHAFGLNRRDLNLCASVLESTDSTAWSLTARREPPLLGHDHVHCSNCLDYALRWRDDLLPRVGLVGSPPWIAQP